MNCTLCTLLLVFPNKSYTRDPKVYDLLSFVGNRVHGEQRENQDAADYPAGKIRRLLKTFSSSIVPVALFS